MSNTIRNVRWITAASLVGYGAGLVRGIIVPRALGPADYGLWGAFSLVLLYGYNLHGGITHAMNRESSVARGAEEPGRVRQIRSTTFTWVACWIVSVTGAILLGTGGYALAGGEHRLAVCMALVALILPLQQLDVYALTVQRTEHRFGEIALSRLLHAGATLLTVVLLLPSLGLYALPLALLVGYGLSGGALFWRLLERPQRRWAPHEARRLLQTGFPLLLVTLVFAALRSADRFVILRYLDFTQLGFYGVAGLFLELMYMVPESIGAVLNPQFYETYGRARSASALSIPLWQSVSTSGLILAPITALIFVTLEYPIRLILPAYVDAIVPAQVLVIGAYFWGTARMTEFVFIAAERSRLVIALQAAATLLNLVLSVVLVRAGLGLVGVALGTATAYTGYGFFTLLLALRLAGAARADAWLRTCAAFWPVLLAGLSIGLVRVLCGPTGTVALNWALVWGAAGRCAVVLVACLPAFWLLSRRLREARVS